MEKLTQDLFQDQKLEEKQTRVAGICATSVGGHSICRTGGGADIGLDWVP